MDFASKLFKGDRIIWVIFLALCLISLIEVFSATSTLAYRSTNYWAPIVRHGVILVAGFGAALFLHNVPYMWFKRLSSLFFLVSTIALLVTPWCGVTINGEARWLSVFGIQFQPSELVKLSSICFMAQKLSLIPILGEKRVFWLIFIAVGFNIILILFNNGSTAILLSFVMFFMMWIGGISKRHLWFLTKVGLIMGTLGITTLLLWPESSIDRLPGRGATWKHRIENHIPGYHKDAEAGTSKKLTLDDENYQKNLAKIAVVNGGIFGKLPGKSQMRDHLPQAYSDFIYAIIIEELGLLGGIFVLFLYLALFFRVGMIAKRCEKFFPKYLIIGCSLMICIQALFNMSVAVGLAPVTGQPLPIISRGGTSTFIFCAYIGIMLSVSRFSANIGNEEDILPEEDLEEKGPVALPGVTPEEISNWVPDASTDPKIDEDEHQTGTSSTKSE